MSLEDKLKKLPASPGVYTYYNAGGDIIYVGKAKILKNRVKQYFQKTNQVGKTAKLVENIADVSWIVTDNETEALMLECNLIKQHRPRYNILLKDDKSYPYIKLTLSDEYTRLVLTRKRINSGDKYFGPYTNSYFARKTIEALNRCYPIKMCTKTVTYGKAVGKVCLNYHIKQCCGVCMGQTPHEEYMSYVNEVSDVLSGNFKLLLSKLDAEMHEQSDKLNFETAAYIKELIECVKGLTQKQKISTSSMDERDIIAIASDRVISCIQLFFVREGRIAATDTKYMNKDETDTDADVLDSFIKQYYMSGVYIPCEILIPLTLDDENALCAMLTEMRGTKAVLHEPKIGDKKRLIELARKNAQMNIDNRRTKEEKLKEDTNRTLGELTEKLGITATLSRIECYDISNIGGTNNVHTRRITCGQVELDFLIGKTLSMNGHAMVFQDNGIWLVVRKFHHIVRPANLTLNLANGVVIAPNVIDADARFVQTTKLPSRPLAGVHIFPLAVKQVASNQHEGHFFFQRQVDDAFERRASGSLHGSHHRIVPQCQTT